MVKDNLIDLAQTEWGAPIVSAPKKNGSVRFCDDYCRLNAKTKRDSYPIPCIDKRINSFAKVAFFSTVDANSGCHQVEIGKTDRNKTASISHQVLFRFIRMPFALRNAPSNFQSTVDPILSSMR